MTYRDLQGAASNQGYIQLERHRSIRRGVDADAMPAPRMGTVFGLGHMVGLDAHDDVHWTTRRRIMSVLRQATRIMGPGQKSRIGRLGSGTAVGAVAMTFAAPAFAGVSVGTGNDQNLANTVAISGASSAGDPGANTNANAGIAIGSRSNVFSGARAGIAIGFDADVATNADAAIAIGELSRANGIDTVAIGRAASASNLASTAVGLRATASAIQSSAFGVDANATGGYATALGNDSTASGFGAVAIGSGARSPGIGAVSLGNDARATADRTTALGLSALASNEGDVALGNGSTTAAPNTGAFTLNGGTASGTAPTSVVSVGTAASPRQIQNVAAGVVSATSRDAVNGSQLFTTATALNNIGDSLETLIGGGAVVDADGTISTSPTYTVGGNTYNSIGGAISAVAAETKYFNVNSALADSSATGGNSIAVGPAAVASASNTIAVGNGANAATGNAIAIGQTASVTGTNASVAIGQNVLTSGNGAVAIGGGGDFGGQTIARGNDSVAIGPDAQTATGAIGATAVGSASRANALFATAYGDNANASGVNAIAIGRQSVSSGRDATAVGVTARATAAGAAAFGGGANAAGTRSAAVGAAASSAGSSSFAGGDGASAAGSNSVALGLSASSVTNDSVAIGNGANVNATPGIAIGRNASVTGSTGVTNGSVAIGHNAATGNNSGFSHNDVALGDGARAGTIAVGAGNNSTANVALGGNSQAEGGVAIAIGWGSRANSGSEAGLAGNVAIGFQANSTGEHSVALGESSSVSGISATAIGHSASASGARATALGAGASAAGASAIALGDSVSASGANSIALGSDGTSAEGDGSVAIGQGQITRGRGAVALGDPNVSNGTGAVVIGADNTAANNLAGTAAASGAVAIGNLNQAIGEGSVALGDNAIGNSPGGGAVALGNNVSAVTNGGGSTGSVSIGSSISNTSRGNSTAIGANINVLSNDVVALGGDLRVDANSNNAILFGSNSTGPSYNINNSPNTLTVITNGNATTISGSARAVTIDTTSSANLNYAGNTGSLVIRTTGADGTANSTSAISGATNSVLINAASPGAAVADVVSIGRNSRTDGNDAVAIGSGATVTGSNGVAIGIGSTAVSQSVALGEGATTTAAQGSALGRSARAGQGATAVGQSTNAGGNFSFAGGNTANAAGLSAVALGNDASAAATNSIAIGGSGGTGTANAARAEAASAIAIGTRSRAATAQSIAIGEGAQATGAQSISIGTGNNVSGANSGAIGDPTVITGTGSYSLGNNNTINANNAFAIGNNITIAAGNDGSVGIGNSTSVGPVNTGAFTLNGGTAAATAPVSVVSVGSVDGERQITSVASGVVSATSTDAINGSQLFTVATAANNLGDSLETVTGAGLVMNVDGTIATLPSFTVAGGTQTNTGAAFDALDDANTLSNTGISSAIGGGMAIAANGTVTPPTVTVGTTNYNNLTDAIEAAGAGFNLTTAATGTGVANGTTVEGIAAGETVTLTAGNNIVTTQVGNETQVALNPALTGITSLAVTGGPTLSGTGIDMGGDKITNLAAGSTAPGSMEAVNGGQLNTGLGSVATNLGGGATYNPATGVVTAPGYAIDGTTYNNVGDALTALAADSKYVDFNSTLAAADASGNNATAIGPNAQASGTSASAFGANSDAAGNNSLAVGSGASAAANNATALGVNSSANGVNSVALGTNSQAGNANAGWTGYTVAGQTMTNNVTGNGVVSISGGSSNRQLTGVADGAVNATSTDAVNGAQLFNTATALDTKATNIGAGLASSLGGGASVAPNGVVTPPSYSLSGNTYNDVGAALDAIDDGKVGLVQQVGGAPGSGALTVGAATGGTSVSFAGTAGDRLLTGVAAGSTGPASVDAVNGSQLNLVSSSVAAHLGGGATYNPATGVVTTPNYVIGGTTYNDVGSALGSLANGGARQRYFNANSTLVDSTAVGVDSVAIGPNAVSTNAGDVALGNGAVSAAPHSGAFTLNGGTVAATAPTSVLSIGAAGNERQIQNVAAGVVSATSTDAVNGSQLFTVATAANNIGNSLATVTGGGLTLNPDGTIATPATINVGGVAYNNTTAAIQAGDAKADAANAGLANALGGGAAVAPDGSVTAPIYTLGGNTYGNVGNALTALANGAVGPVQYANAATPTTPNGGTPSQNLTLVGAAAGPVTLDNVAPGSLAPASTQAVNGGQVNTLGSSVATQLGAGSTFDPVTGQVTAPAFTVAGGTQANVGVAFDALDDANTLANNGLASAIGGGAVVGPNGAVTAPTVTVGTTNYNNLTDAIEAAGAGFNLTTAATGTGVANGTTVEGVSAGETVTLTAGNNIITTQNGNETQIALNPALTGVTSLAITGGPTLSGTGIDMGGDKITNLGAGSTAPGSTDAVNGGQLNTGLASVATGLGGGSTYDPATGTVTAPIISVGGTNHTNVTAAIDATEAKADEGLQDVANALGGGATYDPASGSISGPSYVVSGSTYNNAGDAFAGVNTALTNLTSGTMGLVQQVGGAPGTGQITVGAATGGTSINVAGSAGNRTVTGVAAAALSPSSTDAVNGSQVNALGSSLAANTGGGSTFDPATGTVTAPTITVGGTNYNNVVAAIDATEAKTDEGLQDVANALGGGATYDPATGAISGPSYTIGGATYNNAGAAFGGVNSALTNLTNGTTGLVQQIGGAPGTGQLTVGAATGGTSINVAGTAGNRTVTGVAPAALTPTSTDAVNGSQLNALGSSLAASNGGGSTFNPATGTVSAPTYTLGGNTYNSVSSALTAVSNGATGPLQYSNTATPNAPNGGTPTNSVTLVGAAAGPVRVNNVAAGSTAVGSTQAVNGGQLNTGLTSVATNLGGGSTYDPATGTVTAPSYTIAGNTYNNVGGALGGVDAAISNLTNGTAGLVQQSGGPNGNGPISIGGGMGGTVVNVAGTGGNRTVTGVAPGSLAPTSTDAVNGGQLSRVGGSTAAALGGGAAFDPATGQTTAPSYTVGGTSYNNVGDALAAGNRLGVQYVPDAAGNPTNAVSLGNGTTPVSVSNVAPGVVSATSRDAVNGSQLFAIQQASDSGIQYVRNADGSLNRSTVNFGTAGTPAQLRNVAAGVAATDAVNLGQLQSGMANTLASSKSYTDAAVAGVAFDLRNVAKRSYAGTASALALQSPALFEPGTLSMRGGVGTYRGEWALGLGFRATADNGRWSLSGGVSGGPNSGVAASAGIDFILGD